LAILGNPQQLMARWCHRGARGGSKKHLTEPRKAGYLVTQNPRFRGKFSDLMRPGMVRGTIRSSDEAQLLFD
jgi:hypothetical protein